MKRHPRLTVAIALFIALVVVAGILGPSKSKSKPTPHGPWGQLVGCLQRHPTFSVSAAGSGSGISRHTNSVVVLSQLTGHVIAYLGDTQLGSDGVTGSGAVNVDQIAGPVEYGFAGDASKGARNTVTGCVTSSGVRRGSCAKWTFGPRMTCSFAQAIVAAYLRPHPTTALAHGVIEKVFTLKDPDSGHLDRVVCKALGGVAACAASGDRRLSVAFKVPAIRSLRAAPTVTTAHTSAAATPTTDALQGSRDCSKVGALVAGPNTTCPFALNVQGEYLEANYSKSSSEVQLSISSPVTHKTYPMTCIPSSSLVTCHGGTGAKVQFSTSGAPQAAYCQDGFCEVVTCPTSASSEFICETFPGTSGLPSSQAAQQSSAGSSGSGASGSSGLETAGSYDHASDAQFCSIHSCIGNFSNGNGYIVQCADGSWSHSGGLSGACSDHGGES